MKRKNFLFAVLLAAYPASLAPGGVVSEIDPFVGDLSETWEGFPSYNDTPGFFLDEPTAIMGGSASISNPFMQVYEPGVATFIIGGSPLVFAQVSDGVKGMGLNNFSQTANITFTTPVTEFGAYWGSGSPSNGVVISFFDVNNFLIDSLFFAYDAQIEMGTLIWHGWSSTTDIKSVSYSGDFVVIDGLQANQIPAPGALALLGVAGLLGIRRRRGARPKSATA